MEVSRKVEAEVCGSSSSVVEAWPFVVISSAWGLPVDRGSCWSVVDGSSCDCEVVSIGS
jgi:hypothetical protein